MNPTDGSVMKINWLIPYDKGLHHEDIKIIWGSIISVAVFQMFHNVYRLL